MYVCSTTLMKLSTQRNAYIFRVPAADAKSSQVQAAEVCAYFLF